ncbi:tail fiber protein [Aliivibrio finisterrensis]|nr:tail fiber protein [Aliivibrio finisterrensis]
MVLNSPKVTVSGDSSGGGSLIGAPIYWPLPSCPKGYLPMIGQAFDKVAYPELALVYPDGFLPDSREDYFRIASEGQEPLTRQEQSVQPLGFVGDDLGDHYHPIQYNAAASHGGSRLAGYTNVTSSYSKSTGAASAGTPTGVITGTDVETRPRSLLWNCITRAE